MKSLVSRLTPGRRPGVSQALIAFCIIAGACKSGTPVTATQAVLDSADQVLIGMTHYVTDAGVLRARVRGDTAYFYSNTQRAELRNVHVTFYDQAGNATSTLTSREGTHHRGDELQPGTQRGELGQEFRVG